MSNRTVPFNTTVEEMDNMLFRILGNTFQAMYPNDGRMAIKSAMHVTDKVVEELDALVVRQAKSAQARAAAQARYANPATAQATQAPATPENPAAAPFVLTPPPVKRVRRTKAEIAAANAAAAGQAAPQGGMALPMAAPQPVPMGQVFSQPFPQALTPQPQPVAPPLPATPQPAAPEAPVVTDFNALAQRAAAQGIPQFAPGAQPIAPTTLIPSPPPTFG